MQVKRYKVSNLQEAMVKIRKELGPDAIILSTKKVAGGEPLIEVMAARDEGNEPSVSNDTPCYKNGRLHDEPLNSLRQEICELKSCVDVLTQKIANQRNFLEIMDAVFSGMSAQNAIHLRDIFMRLIVNGISHSKVVRLIEEMKNDFSHQDTVTYEKGAIIAEKLIARSFQKDDRKEKRVKFFIGPTGVGKTTTLAKLAAHYSLEKKMKVGLITTDTYKIAASDQLKVYANIMGLPLNIASEKDLFERAIADFNEKDVILVDTPGRGLNDGRYFQTLKNILDPSMEAVLHISPIASREYLLETANRYKMFNCDRIILTKVDECNHFGPMYDVLDEIGKPVSYMTTGQNVPRDIEKTSPERLAKLILNNRLN